MNKIQNDLKILIVIEITLFSETLEVSREYLESGKKVIVTVEATVEANQLKLLGRSVEAIDSSLAGASAMGLRIFVENAHAVSSVASVLAQTKSQKNRARPGPIEFCLLDQALPGEVTINAGEDFPLNPQIKGALKSLDGVLQVEEI